MYIIDIQFELKDNSKYTKNDSERSQFMFLILLCIYYDINILLVIVVRYKLFDISNRFTAG